jgi:hypothetical protein
VVIESRQLRAGGAVVAGQYDVGEECRTRLTEQNRERRSLAAFRTSMRAMYGADFECFAWLMVKDQIHHNQHHHGNS